MALYLDQCCVPMSSQAVCPQWSLDCNKHGQAQWSWSKIWCPLINASLAVDFNPSTLSLPCFYFIEKHNKWDNLARAWPCNSRIRICFHCNHCTTPILLSIAHIVSVEISRWQSLTKYISNLQITNRMSGAVRTFTQHFNWYKYLHFVSICKTLRKEIS